MNTAWQSRVLMILICSGATLLISLLLALFEPAYWLLYFRTNIFGTLFFAFFTFEVLYRFRRRLNPIWMFVYGVVIILFGSFVNELFDRIVYGILGLSAAFLTSPFPSWSILFPSTTLFPFGLGFVIANWIKLLVTITVAYLLVKQIDLLLITYGPPATDPAQSETTRYLAASMLLGGSVRDKIIQLLEQETTALAPELGIDLPKLGRIAYLLKARARRYHLVYLLLVISTAWNFGLITLLLTAALRFYERYNTEYHYARFLKKDRYDLAGLEAELSAKYTPSISYSALPHPQQNVVIYSGFSPFVGAGIPLGGWSFPINVTRAKELHGVRLDILPFYLNDIYEAITNQVCRSNFPGLIIKDYLFANGKKIRNEHWLLGSIYSRPTDRVDKEQIERYKLWNSTVARYYQWIQVYDWGNEIAVSFLLRLTRTGEFIFVELNRFILPPLSDEHHQIDKLETSGRGIIMLALTSLIFGLPRSLGASLMALGHGFEWASEIDLFGSQASEKERKIRKDKDFDYGARTSIRVQLSSTKYNHYFQLLDQQMYVKVIEKQIIEGIITFLDQHQIDSSDIRDQQTVILNEGLLVQGGDLKIGAVAVGTAAQATSER